MQNLPLISVIIPTYNRGSLILGAVNSVLNQTYRNIELLVVDDCSTDNTSQILENLKDSRIKYIRLEKNSGACTARNKGIEYASGEFIAFNDSDDLWLPEKLERQLAFLKENNADIVLCKMECKTPENEFIHNFPNLDKSQQILSDKKTAESFLKKQAAFVCKTGKNPTEEFALLLKISPGLSVFLRYLLSLVGIYSFLFRLILKK